MTCALPGCGHEVGELQLTKWKLKKGDQQHRAGPFCSRECAQDYLRDIAKRTRVERRKRCG